MALTTKHGVRSDKLAAVDLLSVIAQMFWPGLDSVRSELAPLGQSRGGCNVYTQKFDRDTALPSGQVPSAGSTDCSPIRENAGLAERCEETAS